MPKTKKRRIKPTPDLPNMTGPGVAQDRNPTLERLAVDWIDSKEKLEGAREEESNAKEALTRQMWASNVFSYKWDGHLVQLQPGKDKIFVTHVGGDENPVEE
jgi:hypothetical protein